MCIHWKSLVHLQCSILKAILIIKNSRKAREWVCESCHFKELPFSGVREFHEITVTSPTKINSIDYENIHISSIKSHRKPLSIGHLNTQYLCFYYFQFFFRWSIKFPLQNINQSETEIRGRKLSVEMYVSVLFKLKYSLRLLRRFNFIRYEKQHVRLLLLRCFCILLLNWDIRLPSLCGFHISHRKIRSNTKINTLL